MKLDQKPNATSLNKIKYHITGMGRMSLTHI